jgi:hypothetical protein
LGCRRDLGLRESATEQVQERGARSRLVEPDGLKQLHRCPQENNGQVSGDDSRGVPERAVAFRDSPRRSTQRAGQPDHSVYRCLVARNGTH